MEYRSFNDLTTTISTNLYRLPRDIDLVVGIPRSGLMAGNLIALALNLPITDLDGFLENRKLYKDRYIQPDKTKFLYPKEAKHVLLVDDTIYSGKSIVHALNLIKSIPDGQSITTCTIYANPRSTHMVDVYFEILTSPGCQEWNVMHRDKLEDFCVDIDGVICKDPTKEENDDGPAYLEFLKNATPLMLPTHKIGHLVTGRLEKYRKETEGWLEKYNVEYKELHMLDLPDAETRWKLNASVKFKANVYSTLTQSNLFIESDPIEALQISHLSGKRVVCYSNQKLIKPKLSSALIKTAIKNYHSRMIKKFNRTSQIKPGLA